MEDDGRYFTLVVYPENGVKFNLVKIDKRLLVNDGEFTALVIDKNETDGPDVSIGQK